MVPAVATTGYPANWPTDGRAGGVPDPAAAGPSFIQIGTEGGLLPAPAVIPNQPVGYLYDRSNIVVLNVSTHALMLGPAERADVIVDFSQVPSTCTNIIMYNDSPAPVLRLTRAMITTPATRITPGSAALLRRCPAMDRTPAPSCRFQVSDGCCSTAYNLAALQTALPAAFAASQPAPIVPQAAYNAAYNANYPTDTYARIQDLSMTFTPAGSTSIHSITVTAWRIGVYYRTLCVPRGGSGSGATAVATISGAGVVTAINDHQRRHRIHPHRGAAGCDYLAAAVSDAAATASTAVTLGFQPKAIQELFEPELWPDECHPGRRITSNQWHHPDHSPLWLYRSSHRAHVEFGFRKPDWNTWQTGPRSGRSPIMAWILMPSMSTCSTCS